ncbi:hypothetical protein GQ607_000149 [Colletotrichum asianum]|uniref:Uncharacterized protein n=1 Tax=Colletotrichum asianum TaxID=702518 RepID=A0A8H3WVF7_9PEZI|nr:hypothetical protein GQ607_000149 [Colletotrichum asianum]
MAAAKRGLSGLQREVLALYRQCLREVRKKPEVRLLFLWQVSMNEFDKFLTVDKRDFSVVEHLLRKDRFTKQLEIYARRREAAGNLPVDTPTPESVVSLHTVNALLPYQDQFLAAGLAVTSDQQRPKREPSVSPAKNKGIETVPDEQAKRPAEIRSKELQSRDNPDHLQFNGQRSPSWDSSYDSSLGTQVAFTQPEAWELAYIDEVPEKKPGVPPAQTPTTVDTPNKILDKWHPVYPQKDEVIWIKSPKGIDFRDPRVKTWHGDTAQRPSTYRPARKPQPEDELEATSPTTKRPENQAPEQENVPPIPPRAPGRIKPSVRHQGSTADSATTKGFRKPGQRDVFLDTTDAILVKTKSSTQEPSKEVPIKTPKETTKAQMSTQEPTRISINQPERKAKEKAARQKQQVEVEHPGNFHSGRMFKSLQEPPKLTEQQPKERSATTSLGTLSPKLDLPSTWKLTLSNPSSLEEAIEQASREMEERDIEETQTAGNNQPVLTEKRQPEAVDLTKTVKELFSRPIDKENAPTAKKLPQKNTESSISTYSSLSTERDDRDIDDRDVLRGLNIAISAACDEEVDAWIRQKTGVRIRRFLADLRAFETLAEEDEADPKHERSRIRRTESRKLQAQIRQSKAAREARAQ